MNPKRLSLWMAISLICAVGSYLWTDNFGAGLLTFGVTCICWVWTHAVNEGF